MNNIQWKSHHGIKELVRVELWEMGLKFHGGNMFCHTLYFHAGLVEIVALMLKVIFNNRQVKALVDKTRSHFSGFASVVTKLIGGWTKLLSGKCQFLTATKGWKINVFGKSKICYSGQGLNISYVFYTSTQFDKVISWWDLIC
jgi:hypothetical protein